MKKNVFICHRPYHILRSCDFIYRQKEEKSYNVLVVFDVKQAGIEHYQRFDTNKIFYSFFDDIIELPRTKTPVRRDFCNYIKFCKSKRNLYELIVEKHNDVDKLYFFCDNEIEIQLLVGLFAERMKKTSKRILVDEGMATYDPNSHIKSRRTEFYSKVIALLAGLHFFNYPDNYGGSNYYNESYANCPERAYFHKPIINMPVLSEELCDIIRQRMLVKFTPSNNHPYFLYIGTHEKGMDIEIPVIKHIKSILSKYKIDLYIKLHPQQNEELYKQLLSGFYFINKGYPVELFFSKNAIIGGTISSSLYNAVIQGNKAVILSPLFGLDVQSYFKWVKVPVVKDYDFLESYIVSILNSYK